MLYIDESHIDATQHAGIGDSGVYETAYEDSGSLFRALRGDYGRCIGKVYVERKDREPQAVGWVFQQRRQYEDDPKQTYLHETWITVHERPPEKTVRYFYQEVA